jgi:hypothetical protein
MKTLLILTLLLLSGCGSYAQFTGRAQPQEYVMCSKSSGGGVAGALTGNTEIIKITTQGKISDSVGNGKIRIECGDDAKQLTIDPVD